MQACAKRSVVLLDQAAAGQHTFDVLFLTSHSPVTTYDYLFHVHIPQKLQVQLHAADSTPWQHAETKLEALMKQVCHRHSSDSRMTCQTWTHCYTAGWCQVCRQLLAFLKQSTGEYLSFIKLAAAHPEVLW